MKRTTAQGWPGRSRGNRKVHSANAGVNCGRAMKRRRTMSKLGKKLIVAAREGIAIARGEADSATYRLHVPAKINVRAMRLKLGMTQRTFAMRYGLTLARVRDW